ncbi:MAG: hypothetical protein GWN84_06420 [Gammaproteobacteria bacterium]|nr:hypothetical protein [Gammaproteobacteria bacterium]NIR82531.1 hypothetical protein [Gammaproteobacteria bacterium]NIU03664.1 hypothetical protein [Gammaproteobacteria bacterium]NIV52877.1 hypothetical protein [Gammaproteobacteria bacterium]NIX84938.1 hypothetical protein [Gammaproteobacteria bacterium]
MTRRLNLKLPARALGLRNNSQMRYSLRCTPRHLAAWRRAAASHGAGLTGWIIAVCDSAALADGEPSWTRAAKAAARPLSQWMRVALDAAAGVE